MDELKVRIANWNAKECMGDVFLKFCGKLKAYTNYLNNYQVDHPFPCRALMVIPISQARVQGGPKVPGPPP